MSQELDILPTYGIVAAIVSMAVQDRLVALRQQWYDYCKKERGQFMRRDERGFTLIELMVVVVILGILAGLIIPKIMGRPEEARRLKAKMQIQALETSLKLYYIDNGSYPTTEQGLNALVEKPTIEPIPRRWREGGYVEKGKVPLDPWGNPYVYISPGVHSEDYDLESYGADGEDGGEGKYADVESWDLDKD